MAISRERLADLLVDPREDLDFEIKNWLDLKDSNDDKATFAKAVMAIANHGGGFIAFGMVETGANVAEAEGRPPTLDAFNQDLLNGIVQRYCDPPFHVAVHLIASPQGAVFPIVVIPGGHRVPVRALRSGPNGNTIQDKAIYIRKPGPRSETPQTSKEWDDLLDRCFRNRRDEMFDQIRDLITGAVPQVEKAPETDRLDQWIGKCRRRWADLVAPLPAGLGPKLPFGGFSFAFEIMGDRKPISLAGLPEIIQRSSVRHTGWPPFWYPTRSGIEPYPIDESVECWLGGDDQTPPERRDAAHSDFWRIHPIGLGYLIRGYQEDGLAEKSPQTLFDVTLPVWRVGEAMIYARSLASNLFVGPTTMRFIVSYTGLAGRALASIDNSRNVWEGRIARQASITCATHIAADAVDANLPEIIHPLLSPLYALFDFFELPMELVVAELGKMKASRF